MREIDGEKVFIIISCGLNAVEKLRDGLQVTHTAQAGISYYIPSSTCAHIGDDPWHCALLCRHPRFVRAFFASDRTSSFSSLRAWIKGSTARVLLIFPRAALLAAKFH